MKKIQVRVIVLVASPATVCGGYSILTSLTLSLGCRRLSAVNVVAEQSAEPTPFVSFRLGSALCFKSASTIY